MATVNVSKQITDQACRARAAPLAAAWQARLTKDQSRGEFQIEHGHDQTCKGAHGKPFNGGLWIVSVPRGCQVFRTKAKNARDFAGAGRHAAPGAYGGSCEKRCGH